MTEVPLTATYRLQFSAGFRFADAAALAPYLADLGISHVYCSPVFAARPGSTHGYDVTDPNRFNPELGTEAEFRAMAASFRARGLGLILDVVPNHFGIGGAANAFWLSVLEWGPESPYAGWFDIDWESRVPGLAGKVLVPFLGGQYGEVLADGGLELRFDRDEGSFAVWAHGTHKLPIRPEDYGGILRAAGRGELAAAFDEAAGSGAGMPRWRELKAQLRGVADEDVAPGLAAYAGERGDPASWGRLDALIARQHWRAAKFNFDNDAINYRRFFTISDLAGVRVEAPEVFEATHGLAIGLVREGVVDGLRIDHIDGLLDPKGYTLRLRRHAGPFHLLVEKILAPDEALSAEWQADGTTGYEFANLLVGLLVDPAGTEALSQGYAEFTGRREPPEEVVHAAKRAIMDRPMAAEVEAATARLVRLASRTLRYRDLGGGALRLGLKEFVAALPVYRTYADADGLRPEDRRRIEGAVAIARHRSPALDPGVFDFIGEVLTLDLAKHRPEDADEVLAAAMRLQQLSGPVMAKGLEDTALYRFNRLIALNEVGSEPGRYGVGLAEFHRENAARLARTPRGMLATSTHDTKRGEDARARIAALSGHAELWREKVFEWHELLADPERPVDRNEEYFFYQLLLGAWPVEWSGRGVPAAADLRAFAARMEAAMLKSVREAGVNTRWVFGDAEYEARLAGFIGRALDPSPGNGFLRSFCAFEPAVARDGAVNGLIQTALKLTVPGVPDIYQGAELWDQSLVDPDNRRPVDYAARAEMLRRLDGRGPVPLIAPESKLELICALLAWRRARPALFERGDYVPLAASGAAAGSLCAFVRRHGGELLVVAAALHPGSRGPDAWADTRLEAPAGIPGRLRDLLSGEEVGELAPQALFRSGPVAVLVAG